MLDYSEDSPYLVRMVQRMTQAAKGTLDYHFPAHMYPPIPNYIRMGAARMQIKHRVDTSIKTLLQRSTNIRQLGPAIQSVSWDAPCLLIL
jgi:hypothetical protein